MSHLNLVVNQLSTNEKSQKKENEVKRIDLQKNGFAIYSTDKAVELVKNALGINLK